MLRNAWIDYGQAFYFVPVQVNYQSRWHAYVERKPCRHTHCVLERLMVWTTATLQYMLSRRLSSAHGADRPTAGVPFQPARMLDTATECQAVESVEMGREDRVGTRSARGGTPKPTRTTVFWTGGQSRELGVKRHSVTDQGGTGAGLVEPIVLMTRIRFVMS